MPCNVPKTEGWGDELLSRIVDAGNAKVRPATRIKRTQQRLIQIRGPSFSDGGGVFDGISERNGTSAYAIGKKYKKNLHVLVVPKRSLILGYTKSCMEMPIAPSIDMANPMCRGGMPSPPVKTKGRRCLKSGGLGCFGSATGVDKNTNQRLLKVPRCKEISQYASNVNVTFLVNIRLKGSLCLNRGTAFGCDWACFAISVSSSGVVCASSLGRRGT